MADEKAGLKDEKLATLLVVAKAGKKAVPRDERMVDVKAGLKDEKMVE